MKPLGIFSGLIKRLPSATTLETQASTTAAASLNVPHGSAPSSPVDGDVWTTGAGLFVRVNGATVGPLVDAVGGGGGGGGLTALAQVEVTVAQPTIDFSSIPSTYEDLVVVFQGRGTAATTSMDVLLRFNNDSAANYDYARWNRFGTVANVAQTSAQIGSVAGASAPTGRSGQSTLEVNNYARTAFYKSAYVGSMISAGTTTNDQIFQQSSIQWRSTAAVNRVTLLFSSGNWDVGTVATLYGRSN